MDQAERRLRPLARRAFSIARPARVDILSRKPWVRLRFKLLGWKVRLLIFSLPFFYKSMQFHGTLEKFQTSANHSDRFSDHRKSIASTVPA
jgi:hypothetical protein